MSVARALVHGERRFVFRSTQPGAGWETGLTLRDGVEYTLFMVTQRGTIDLYAGTDAPIATYLGSLVEVEE